MIVEIPQTSTMITLPKCPLCGHSADPRWRYRGTMFCDGCCPTSDSRPWLIERCDHAIAREAEVSRLTAALEAYRKEEE